MRPEAFVASLVAVVNGAMSYGGQPSATFSATPRWVFPTWRGGNTPVVFSVVLADKSGMRAFTFKVTLQQLRDKSLWRELANKVYYWV